MIYLKETDSIAETTTPNSPSTRFQPESSHQRMELDKAVSTTSAALDSDIPNDAVIDNDDHRLITSDINNSSTNPLTTNDLGACVAPTEEDFGGFDRDQEVDDDDEFGNFDSDQDDDGFGSFDDECFDESNFSTLPEPEQKEPMDVS